MILEHLPERAHLIDVRTVEEYKGGIDGAQNIPIDEIEEAILIAIPEKSDVVIVYCRSGNCSAQAGKMLEDLGYKVILDAEVSLTMKSLSSKIKCKRSGSVELGANQSRSRVAWGSKPNSE